MREELVLLRCARHDVLATEITNEKSVADCAKLCSVTEGTIYRWRKHKVTRPHFRNYRKLSMLATNRNSIEAMKLQ